MREVDFFEITSRVCSASARIYLLVTKSHFWDQNARDWLAQFAANKLVELGYEPTIVSEVPDGWNYPRYPIIALDKFYEQVNSIDDLLIFSVSHHCPLAIEIEASNRFKTLDMTAYCLDSGKIGIGYVNDNWSKVQEVLSILKDTTSRSTYLNVLLARITGDLRSIKPSIYPIYQHPALKNLDGLDGHIIDAGSFDGSEAYRFADKLNDPFCVFGYEFDHDNYQKFLSSSANHKVQFINKGLWSKSGYALIEGSGIAATVKEFSLIPADNLAPMVSLDQEFYGKTKVGFIKMDIEGAEYEAILGAKNIIQYQAPYLALSIYHKAEDLWTIPLLIQKINPHYEFYFGQHDQLLSESVLYCVPRT